MQYRNYKSVDENIFLYDLSNSELTINFTYILYKHAPVKHKIVRGNNASFMTKELQKAIMKRSNSKANSTAQKLMKAGKNLGSKEIFVLKSKGKLKYRTLKPLQ